VENQVAGDGTPRRIQYAKVGADSRLPVFFRLCAVPDYHAAGLIGLRLHLLLPCTIERIISRKAAKKQKYLPHDYMGDAHGCASIVEGMDAVSDCRRKSRRLRQGDTEAVSGSRQGAKKEISPQRTQSSQRKENHLIAKSLMSPAKSGGSLN
jgi:hypothetical protein